MKNSAYALVLCMSGAAFAQDAARPTNPKPFFTKTNIALFSADALVRSLDAASTNQNVFNPCKCFKEDNVSFATGTKAGTWAFSEGMVALNIGAAYALHRMHHDKLAKLVPMIDIAYDLPAAVHNEQISGHVPVAVAGGKPFLPTHGGGIK